MRSLGVLGRAAPAALALALAAVACSGSSEGEAGAENTLKPGTATYSDPGGDSAGLPDIRTIEVMSAPGGRITFRVSLAKYTMRSKTGVDLWLDTDADPNTGNTTFAGADGADYLFMGFLGVAPPGDSCSIGSSGCLVRYGSNGWAAADAPTARVTRTATGVTFSINRSDLGNTDELNFFAVRGGDEDIDRAPGVGTFNYSLALGGPRPEAVASTGRREDKAGGKGAGTPEVLTLATQNYSDPWATYFAAAVERLSNGSIRIDVKDGWRYYEIDGERGMIADVRHGDFDLVVVGARAWDAAGVKSFNALVAPFLIDSFARERRVFESGLVDRMLDGVQPLGLVGLAALPGEPRRPLGVTRALVGPTDYEGAKIGIRPAEVAKVTFEALGGSARGFPSTPTGLSGFDGAESGVPTIANNRYDRRARALTANVVLWPRATTIVMNGKAFAALTPGQQEILRSAGRETVAPLLKEFQDSERTSLETICRAGHLSFVSASPRDRAALLRAVRPVYDELERDSLTRELIGEIEDLIADERGAADEPLHCARTRAAPGPAALQAGWRTDLTFEDLLATGASRDEIRNGSEGSWELDLHDGRWVVRSRPSGLTGRGTYTVDGNTLRLVVTSCTPVGACGGLAQYTWSVYRDRLTLDRIPGRNAWLPLIASPWTRAR